MSSYYVFEVFWERRRFRSFTVTAGPTRPCYIEAQTQMQANLARTKQRPNTNPRGDARNKLISVYFAWFSLVFSITPVSSVICLVLQKYCVDTPALQIISHMMQPLKIRIRARYFSSLHGRCVSRTLFFQGENLGVVKSDRYSISDLVGVLHARILVHWIVGEEQSV